MLLLYFQTTLEMQHFFIPSKYEGNASKLQVRKFVNVLALVTVCGATSGSQQ